MYTTTQIIQAIAPTCIGVILLCVILFFQWRLYKDVKNGKYKL